jgi:tetratricopeptide (TPR) repeat protein
MNQRGTAYNQAVVHTFFPIRKTSWQRFAAGIGLVLALAGSPMIFAMGQAGSDGGGPSAAVDRGRILLVLPFENRTGQPSLDWIREAAAELLSSRFVSAGFEPMSRADRIYALDHLGLPEGFNPSRASSLKLAQTLDADSIVVGSYILDGNSIVAEARLVNVPALRMSEVVTAHGDLKDQIDVFDSLAWKLTRELDPGFSGSEETFVDAGKGIRLDAFEQYIRGITETDQAQRLADLEKAVKLSPEFSPTWMALGREAYNGQQYEQAADAFAKVDKNSPDGLEAGYYRGLSLLFSGDYKKAEQAFAGVARILPLAEVVNNEGVAQSRQGHDGTDLFIKAEEVDPSAPDYHFNLAVSLQRHGQTAAALNELDQCLKLRPGDEEAQALEAAWKKPAAPKPPPAAAQDAAAGAAKPSPDADASADPLERIVRSFDAAAFRQAAQMMDQMGSTRLAELSPLERAKSLSAQASGFLDRGLLLEAERLYQAAVVADDKCAEAHAGLAMVSERTGAADSARKEAHSALELEPRVDAYLVLGRLDLEESHLNEALNEGAEALKLDPASQAAQELVREVKAKSGQGK